MHRTGTKALLSHWRRRPLQLTTLVIGLALATALWSGVQAINAEARASYAEAAQTLGDTEFVQLVPSAADALPIDIFVALRRAGHLVSPFLEGTIEVDGTTYRMIGFDPLTVPQGFTGSEVGELTDITGFFAPPYQIFANPSDAPKLESLGATIVAVESIAPGIVLTDLSAAQAWLGREGQISRMIVLPETPFNAPKLVPTDYGLELRAPRQGNDIARLTDSFHLNLTAFGLLSFAVGLFIVHSAIGLAFEQRRPLFRTLRALGLPLRALLALLATELLAISLIAGSLGMALGYVIAAALLPDVSATLRGLYGASVDGTLSLRLSWWFAGLGIAIAGTALAAASAMLKVAQMPLLAPAKPRAWAVASERRMWLLGGASALLIIIALITAQFSGLVAGFALLGALLIAAALTLPLVLFAALTLAQRLAQHALAQWFWADTRQQLPGLSLALMALLLALATNVGVGTMVSSFRLTFTGYLDQRLSSELYVSVEEAESQALQDFLASRADAVLPIWNIKGQASGLPAEIYGIVDHPTYQENWPVLEALPDAWGVLNRGEGVLINEQLALRQSLSPGDALSLPGGWTMPVAGVYSDYGNPIGQVIVALPELLARFPDVARTRFGIRVAPEKVASLAQELREEFGLSADQMVDQASLKAFSLAVFERTFTVTAALNVLTLAVAGFAILTSLLTLAAIRQPQLAPVWAIGLTRRKLAALELARALVLALFTMVAALPVGLLLAWVLLNVINVEAFGWRLPMHAFPVDWAWLGLWSLLAAVLAALWPAIRLARLPQSELLKVFAHER